MKAKFILKLLFRYISILLLIAIALSFIHHYLYTSFWQHILFNPIWMVYTFLASLSLLAFAMVGMTYYVEEKYTGFAFMGSVLIKMLASLAFLYPLLKSQVADKVIDVANFFIPFFIFLFIEVWFSIQLLQPKKSELKDCEA